MGASHHAWPRSLDKGAVPSDRSMRAATPAPEDETMPRQSDPAKRVDVDGWPAVAGPRRPLAMVYGGGGVFGIAYGMGVATGLREAGIPVHEAPALGTSAGSWVAGVLVLGLTYEDLRGLPPTPVPTREPVLY